MKRLVTTASLAALMATGLVTVGTSATSGAATTKPIVVGYISDLTGSASSTFADGPGGAQAIVDSVNAKGGIHGHKLQLVVKDDASTSNGNLTAAKELVADHADVIVDYSSFAFGGAQYLAQQKVPVVGSAFDGPEWATKGFTNMFTWAPPSESPLNGKLYTTTALGTFLKKLKVTSFGGLGYGISPSSTDSILESNTSVEHSGIKVCYTNNTVAFGAVTFTSDVLQIKAANCDSVAGSFVEASDLALSTAMKHAGLTKKVEIFFTGYDAETTKTAAAAAGFDGDYAEAQINFSPPNAAASALLATLKKYDKSYTGGIPDYGLLGSTVSTQLAVYGLEHAGSNPTTASFISNLRKVKSWTDTGVLPSPIGFTGFGTSAMFPKKECEFYQKLTGKTWKANEACGTLLTMPAPTS
jgi:branched-chain amino acid transport system substrate-binding protein